MTSKTKILSIGALLTQITLQALTPLENPSILDRALQKVATSKGLTWFNKNIQTKLSVPLSALCKIDGPASENYQALGEEAQQLLGIPPERRVPIKRLGQSSPFKQFIAAMAFPDFICVNEERLNTTSSSYRRFAMIHEAVHLKYNDMASNTLIEEGTLLILTGGSFLLSKMLFPHSSTLKRSLGSLIFGVAFGATASRLSLKYMERRADIEAINALQCSTCVQEVADRRRISFESENNPLKNNGYLWAHDLEKVANTLKADGKLCAHHSA